MKSESIVYVNFSPYENTGHILDFILNEYEDVLLFVFSFHKLSKKESNKLIIFNKGKIVSEMSLLQIPTPEILIFLFIPLRSSLNMLQLVWHLFKLKKKYKKYDVYFTVNAFTAWVGCILKKIKMVKHTIFWVWDYYPPLHPNLITVFMRSLYWMFDKYATNNIDVVVFLNKRLLMLRQDIGILKNPNNYQIVPIGTKVEKTFKKNTTQLSLCFIGVVKKSQGLDLFFDNIKMIRNKFPGLSLHIIGDGPDLSYYKKRASRSGVNVKFYGLLNITDPMVLKVFSESNIGFAPYKPEAGNVSYYGDPSKIKMYISFGLPVVTTDVFYFSSELKDSGAGIIVSYEEPHSLLNAFSEIINNYEKFQNDSYKLARKYEYKKMYHKLFLK